ncbi:MAG: hypothetical protein ACPL4H_04535 [Anaerolineales bacterium]
MKFRKALIVIFATILLVSSTAIAQAGKSIDTDTYEKKRSSQEYHLNIITTQVLGISSGGSYRLSSPLGVTGTGTPCCCNYLPCVLRNY